MNEQRDEREKRTRLNLTTSQVAASALAACCASIVASYLGVAGTVIGAAVGSVVATTGAAVYGHLFRRGSARLRATLQVNGRTAEGADGADGVGAPLGAAIPEGAAGAAGREARPGSRAVPAARGRFYGASQTEARTGAGAKAGQDETRAKLWLPASSTAQMPAARQTARVSAEPAAWAPGTARKTTTAPSAANPPTAPTARMPQTPATGGEPAVLAGGRGGHGRYDGPTRNGDGRSAAYRAPGAPGAALEAAGNDAAPGGGRAGAVTGIRRYGRPIGVAAAIVAVFCVAITVGFLLGGPVRSAGASSGPPASTAPHSQDTGSGQDGGGQTQTTDPSASPSATPSGSASSTGPSSTPTATPSTGTPSTSPSATAGATGTGGASTPSSQPHAGATAAGSNGP
jgi:hypothetical protein